MLKVFPIRGDRSAYFSGGAPGRWQGSAAQRLGLSGPVDLDDLGGLLGGIDPRTAARLDGLSARRTRAGFEIIVAAPKSVSLLATMGGDGRTGIVSRAHQSAVADVIAYLERHAAFLRSHKQVLPSGGLAVASFTHRRNAAGEPHLHTHSVIPNLTPMADGWRCLHTRPLWEHRRAGSALYFMAMDAHLRANGLHLRWEPGPGGTPEVAGVPRAAIVAASSRSAQVRATTRQGRQWDDNELARKRTHNRRPDARWPEAVAAAGFDRRRATAILDAATGLPSSRTSNAVDLDVVEQRLLAKGSLFRAADAMEAVAQSAPPGTTIEVAERWAREVCDRARPVGGRQFLSPHAERSDERVAAAALERRGAGAGVAFTTLDIARWSAPLLDPQAAAALERLVTAGHGVEIIGRGRAGPEEAPLLAQAAVIDAARVAWQAAGYQVAVLPAPGREAQWRALTSLDAVAADGPFPSVLVVDRAERMATPELAAVLHHAARSATKVLLVEGGTLPAREQPRSEAFARVVRQLASIDPGMAPPVEAIGHRALSGDGERTAALSGSDAIGHLFQSWSQQPRTMMVARGVPEITALNAAARRHLDARGALRGPSVLLDGRELREGERVMALARGAGALGTIMALDTQSATVRWDSGLTSTLTAETAGHLGYGYAATPDLARRADAILLSLGDADGLGMAGDRVAASWVVAPTRPRELAGGLIRPPGRPPGHQSATQAVTSARAVDAHHDLEAVLSTRRPEGLEVVADHHLAISSLRSGLRVEQERIRDTGLGL